MFTTALASTLKERRVVVQVICGTEDGEQIFPLVERVFHPQYRDATAQN